MMLTYNKIKLASYALIKKCPKVKITIKRMSIMFDIKNKMSKTN
jgi:hypothetical protein